MDKPFTSFEGRLVCPWLRFVGEAGEERLYLFKEVVDGEDYDEGEDCGYGESAICSLL